MCTNIDKIVGLAVDFIPELQGILRQNGWGRDLIDNPYQKIDYAAMFAESPEYKTTLEQMVIFLAEKSLHFEACYKKIVAEGLSATVIQVKDTELDHELRVKYYEAYLKKPGTYKLVPPAIE